MKEEIKLIKVEFFPETFSPGVLYVSEEYKIAGHLCPCGCGSQVITPLGPAEWCFTEDKGKASLEPSIGNWQLPCRSHYWIENGAVKWSYSFTKEEIEEGDRIEDERRSEYYRKLQKGKHSIIYKRFWSWVFSK